MTTIHESARLPCTPDTFWKLHHDADHLRALHLDALGFRAFEVLELSDDTRKVRCVPRLELPGPLERLVGDGFAYEEHGTLDRSAGEWRWRMVQPRDVGARGRASALVMHGIVRVTPLDAGACTRTEEITLESKLFGLGGLLDATLAKQLRASRARETAFLRARLAAS